MFAIVLLVLLGVEQGWRSGMVSTIAFHQSQLFIQFPCYVFVSLSKPDRSGVGGLGNRKRKAKQQWNVNIISNKNLLRICAFLK